MSTSRRDGAGWPLNLVLLVLTALSTFGVQYLATADWWDGALYAFSVMLILGAHEMGHYLMARAHRVDATLPYFIPLPLGFGTLGAVIRLKGKVPTRNALVDIGAAGPLAGLLIAIPLLAVGTMLSHPAELAQTAPSTTFPTMSLWNLADLFGKWMKLKVWGTPMPPFPQVELLRDNLLSLGFIKLFWGNLPANTDLVAHPVLIAGWFGMLVTMLNLLPVGQLDGGHLTHAWFGEKAERVGHHIASLALLLALFCSVSWLVWFFLITRIVGFKHPPVVDESAPLSRGRKAIIVIAWVMTVLTFMPIPIDVI